MPFSKEDHILYLSRQDVETICNTIDSVVIIREVFTLHGAGQTNLPDEAYLSWTNDQGESVRSLNMPGYLGGSLNVAGTKIINGNIANPSRGLPRASGLTLIYDRTSVRINCIMEGAYISSLRTASVTALSVELFQGKALERVAIIGAGVLAQAHIELLVKRFPSLRTIQIFDLDTARVAALKANIAGLLRKHEVQLEEKGSAEAAIRDTDLIVPATTTTQGYIQFRWLQPGAILVNISLDDPLPEVVFQANKVIVDDWNLVKNDPRRLIGRMYRAHQVIGPDEPESAAAHQQVRRIDAQLGDIVTGARVGREHPDDRILVNPFGLAIEDVALAARIYQAALEQDRGLWLAR